MLEIHDGSSDDPKMARKDHAEQGGVQAKVFRASSRDTIAGVQ